MDQCVLSAIILNFILGLFLNSAIAMVSLIDSNVSIKLFLIIFALPPLVNSHYQLAPRLRSSLKNCLIPIIIIMLAVPVSSIFSKCVHVPIRGAHFDYMPNMFEHH